MQDLRQCDCGRPLGNSWEISPELGNPIKIRPEGRPDGIGPGRSLHRAFWRLTRWMAQLKGLEQTTPGGLATRSSLL
jgi:hypothetical protein